MSENFFRTMVVALLILITVFAGLTYFKVNEISGGKSLSRMLGSPN